MSSRFIVFSATGAFVALAACRDDSAVDTTLIAPFPDASVDGTAPDAARDASSSDAGPDAALSEAGAGAFLLSGTIVTPDTSFDGQVLVVGDRITCAKAGTACASEAGASGAVVIDTHGVISPGLVDTHNHILFDIHDNDDWKPSRLYTNHDDWTKPANEPRYPAMLDTIQCLASETGKPVWCPAKYAGNGNLRCELEKWGELKAMIAGTTSVVGLPGIASGCFASLSRSIDTPYNGMNPGGANLDQVYTSALFPPGTSATTACAAVTSGKGKAYLIHTGEGLPSDAKAAAEFDKLAALTTAQPGCFMHAATTVTHGVAFTAAQFATMAANGMKLTWSPQSNVSLYGATADIPAAIAAGVVVALGPDWSMGGSQNMLDELRFADAWDNQNWGNKLSAKDIVTMATKNGGIVTSYGDRIGKIEAGYFADLFVVPMGAAATPYDAVIAAKPKDIVLTMIAGKLVYGDAALKGKDPRASGCEDIDICSTPKFICVAEPDPNGQKLSQKYTDIKAILEAALVDLDTTDKGDASVPFTFAPLTPIVKCQ